MVDVRPDPKPLSEGGIGRKKPDRGRRRRGRVTASRDEWLRLRALKLDGQLCRICAVYAVGDSPTWQARELHHLIARSLGGDDVADNLIPVCREHHTLITCRLSTTLALLAEQLSDAEYAYIIGKLGEGAMERLFGVGA